MGAEIAGSADACAAPNALHHNTENSNSSIQYFIDVTSDFDDLTDTYTACYSMDQAGGDGNTFGKFNGFLGYIYQYNPPTNISGTSNLVNGTTVRAAIEGVLATETTTVNAGVFDMDITSVDPVVGDSVIVFVDIADVDEATAATVYDGMPNDITNMTLNSNEFTIVGSGTQKIGFADLADF